MNISQWRDRMDWEENQRRPTGWGVEIICWTITVLIVVCSMMLALGY